MTPRLLLLPAALCATALALGLPAASHAADSRAAAFAARGAAAPKFRSGELVVRYAPTGAHASAAGAVPKTKVVKVRNVAAAERRLRKQRGVLSVTRNYVAHVSGW